jgi:hypothetical protein
MPTVIYLIETHNSQTGLIDDGTNALNIMISNYKTKNIYHRGTQPSDLSI